MVPNAPTNPNVQICTTGLLDESKNARENNDFLSYDCNHALLNTICKKKKKKVKNNKHSERHCVRQI